MAIPESWSPRTQARAEKFLSLLKYYRMSRTLGELAAPFFVAQDQGRLSDPDEIVRGSALVSYWLASLHTLCEGWQSLRLADEAVDASLTPEHLLLLKRYRHTVYHFQGSLEESRVAAFERNPHAIGWAITLGAAFQEFFDPHLHAVQVERIRSWLFAEESAG